MGKFPYALQLSLQRYNIFHRAFFPPQLLSYIHVCIFWNKIVFIFSKKSLLKIVTALYITLYHDKTFLQAQGLIWLNSFANFEPINICL